VPGTVSYLNPTAAFLPDAALPLSTPFTATLTTGISDLAGNHLGTSYSWSFTTVGSQLGSWQATSLTGAPFARNGHVAVWTGSEMIVSGGLAWDTDWSRFEYTTQFGRYKPETGIWSVASGAPAGVYQKAVWTGSRMLVFGGYEAGTALTRGAAYDPVADAWSALSTAGQPSARYGHTAVWTGSEMIVWGGRVSSSSTTGLGTGARYNPATDTWQPVSMTGAPSPRYGHSAVWTGSEMIVWGGSYLADGARYNPATDTWTPLSTAGAPSGRLDHTAVWTGSEMIVWGGWNNSGGIYSPVSNTWRATDTLCAPAARSNIPAVWTGSRMILWGPNDGYVFDPGGNVWQQVSAIDAPSSRSQHSMVWTGSKAIVWGGSGNGVLNSGAILTP
jgi:N-acetylneuraminic acid mutarotase